MDVQHHHATALLLEAAQTVNRPEMGKAALVYETTARLWQTYIGVRLAQDRDLQAHDVMQLLSLLAVAKSTWHPEAPPKGEYVEQAMCAAGAAQLSGIIYPKQEEPQPEEPKQEEPKRKVLFDKPLPPQSPEEKADVATAIDAIVKANKDRQHN